MSVARSLFVISVAWLVASPSYTAIGDDRDAQVAMAMFEAHVANLRAFTPFVCRYIVRDGDAASRDDALAGRFHVVERSEGLWALDGEYEVLYISADDEALLRKLHQQSAQSTDSIISSRQLGTHLYARNSELIVTCLPAHRVGNIFPNGDMRRVGYTPTFIGVGPASGVGVELTPASAIPRAVSRGRAEAISLIRESTPTGTPTRVRWTGGTFYNDLSFDRTRGWLLDHVLFVYQPEEEGTTEVVLLDATYHEGIGWFPARILRIDKPRAPRGVRVQEVSLRELIVHEVIDWQAIAPLIPESTQLSNIYEEGALFTTRAEVLVTPQSLPELVTMSQAAAEEYRARPQRSHRRPAGGLPSSSMIAFALCVCAVIVAWRVARSRFHDA